MAGFAPLAGLLGGVGAGVQGYETGRANEAQIQSTELDNAQEEQTMSAAPLMFIQQRIKAHPELGQDAQTIQMLNKFGKPFGIQADPTKGIDSSFANYDLLSVVNPMQAARVNAELENKFLGGLPQILRNPGDKLTNLRMYIASAPPGVDRTGLVQMLGDPTVQQQLTSDYALQIQKAMSGLNKDQALTNLDVERAQRIAGLFPLEAQQMAAHAGLYNAQTGAANALTNWRNNDTFVKIGTLNETIRRDSLTYDAKVKALANSKDANAERKRHDLASEIHNYINDKRQLFNSYFGVLQSEQQNGQFSSEGMGQMLQLINGTDDQSGNHQPGVLDLFQAMGAGADALNAMPSPQPTGLPQGTKATPRGQQDKGVVYDTGRKLLIVSGPNRGKGVYGGYLYDPVKGRLGKYSPASGDSYTPAGQ